MDTNPPPHHSVPEKNASRPILAAPGCRGPRHLCERCHSATIQRDPELVRPESFSDPQKCSHVRCFCYRILFYLQHPLYTTWHVMFSASFLHWSEAILFVFLCVTGIWFQFYFANTGSDSCSKAPESAFFHAWVRTSAVNAFSAGYFTAINYAYSQYVGGEGCSNVTKILHLALIPSLVAPYWQGLWAMVWAMHDRCH